MRGADSQVAERAFARSLLHSEILKTQLLLGAMLGVLATIFVLKTLGSKASHVQAVQASGALVVIPLFLLYEGIVLGWLLKKRHAADGSPTWFHYLHGFIEVSVPGVILFVLVDNIGIVAALTGGVPWLYFLLIALSALYLSFPLSSALGLCAAIQYGFFVLLAYSQGEIGAGTNVANSGMVHFFKMACLIATGLVTGFVARQISRQLKSAIQALGERNRAVSIFGQHVSPQVANMLLNQPTGLTGEERKVCVMFLDIRNFSQYAALHSPAEVMEYLNVLFERLIRVVNHHDGIVNKFLGDGFMAVFGAPVDNGEPCQKAVQAAREILGVVRDLNDSGRVAPTRLGIGLHFGEAVTGNVGSPERKEYTIIGDVVNLAARIEQATKTFQAELLVSETVQQNLVEPQSTAIDLGLVDLKGQSKPVRLYRLA